MIGNPEHRLGFLEPGITRLKSGRLISMLALVAETISDKPLVSVPVTSPFSV